MYDTSQYGSYDLNVYLSVAAPPSAGLGCCTTIFWVILLGGKGSVNIPISGFKSC